MKPEKLTLKDVDLLMRLVDDEIHRICNEAPLHPLPEAVKLTDSDCRLLKTARISWEGDTRA